MEENQRIDYIGRFTTLFILMGVSFSLLFFVILYFQEKSYHSILNQARGDQYLSDQQEKFYAFFHNYEQYLYAIESNRFFTDFLSHPSPEKRSDVVDLFKTLVEHDVQVTQLRYIDKTGQEIVRVERPVLTSDVIVIEPEALQNKSDREYFQTTMKKETDELYVSKLDLNIEHGTIEVPHKPVWRFAIPVFKDARPEGMLIVNVFTQPLLDHLVSSMLFNVYVYDQEGYVLVSNTKETPQWSRYVAPHERVDPNTLIAQKRLIEGIGGETISIGLRSKNEDLFDIKNTQQSFLIMLGVTVPIAFILAYWIAKIPRRLFDRLDKQQKMMVQQSKQAAMGEMISAIAHQWRQPLNAVGVLVQEIETKYQLDALTKEEMEFLSNEVLDYLDYMSKTIADFTNFLKPSTQTLVFDVQRALDETLKLIDSQLQNHSITYSVEVREGAEKDGFRVKGSPSEFKQALMNILHNAKDVLETKENRSKHIAITLQRDREKITLKIADNGGGIGEEMLEDLFEPYKSSKYEQQGTGLGLYIAKMIVERQMGGKIRAKNRGDGAEFEIVLPAQSDEEGPERIG